MSHKGVQLPILQNWSCHSCGGCCREHQIGVTEQERLRIEKLVWGPEDRIPADRPLLVRSGNGWRLNHQQDGACVFLSETGLCRIHARHGEAAKPLACLVYPYAVHPAGQTVTTSLRFSCPSVVQNLGTPVVQQRSFLENLAARIVPQDYSAPEAPLLRPGRKFSWSDLMRLQAFLERSLSDARVSFAVRLVRILSWLDLLDQTGDAVTESDQLTRLLTVLHEAAVRAVPDETLPDTRPARIARMMFRQLLAQLIRHDTDVVARTGIRGRLSLLGQGLRFTLGRGVVPQNPDPASVDVAFRLRAGLPPIPRKSVRFSELEVPFGGRNREFDELFSRYFRVKVQGIHFCGRAYYDMPVIDGFRSLALMYPATLWMARLRAAAEGRTTLRLRDVEAALAILDHNFGYSPALGLRSSRQRISQLASLQQLTALCCWYSL